MSTMRKMLDSKFRPLVQQCTHAEHTPTVAFVANGGSERGCWLVTNDGVEVRGTITADDADLTIEARAEVLVMFCLAALDIQAALANGLIKFSGDLQILERLAGAGTHPHQR